MTEQLILEPVTVDPVATRRQADAGMAMSQDGRSDLARALDEAIETVAKTHATFTADLVWLEFGGIPNHKGMASAMGPALRRAAYKGVIQNTRTFASCERPKSHGNPLRVWRSLIRVKGAA